MPRDWSITIRIVRTGQKLGIPESEAFKEGKTEFKAIRVTKKEIPPRVILTVGHYTHDLELEPVNVSAGKNLGDKSFD